MVNVVVPTDFSIPSLDIIHNVVAKYPDERINIYLIHALRSSNSISDLLFISKRLNVGNLYDQDFMDACEIIKNKYESVLARIKIEIYYGESRKYLKSFLEHRNICAVFFAKTYRFKEISAHSQDMHLLFKNAAVPLYYETVTTGQKHKNTVQEHVSAEILV